MARKWKGIDYFAAGASFFIACAIVLGILGTVAFGRTESSNPIWKGPTGAPGAAGTNAQDYPTICTNETSVAVAVNTNYIFNASSNINVTLPATCTKGDQVSLTTLLPNVTIYIGITTTTIGHVGKYVCDCNNTWLSTDETVFQGVRGITFTGTADINTALSVNAEATSPAPITLTGGTGATVTFVFSRVGSRVTIGWTTIIAGTATGGGPVIATVVTAAQIATFLPTTSKIVTLAYALPLGTAPGTLVVSGPTASTPSAISFYAAAGANWGSSASYSIPIGSVSYYLQ